MGATRRLRLTLPIALAVWLAGPAGATPFFAGLGDLPGGETHSRVSTAGALSGDGTTVVGTTLVVAGGAEAYRWTRSGGMVSLVPDANGFATNADGSVVVGRTGLSSSAPQAYRRTQVGGIVGLGAPAGGFSLATGTSGDGSVVVGHSIVTVGVDSEAFRWTQAEGVVALGFLPGYQQSFAADVSSDGLVIVGSTSTVSGPFAASEAYYWTQAHGMVGLGHLPGGSFSQAHGISSDGSVIVGTSRSTSGTEAFRWSQAGGMVGLGDLAGGGFRSVALDANADGSVVVGVGQTDAAPEEAFIWTQAQGMQLLAGVLTDLGLDLTGWTLETAWSVSDDGLTIAGNATNPLGDKEAFVAYLPEPGIAWLVAPALLAAALGKRAPEARERRRRRRRL